MKSFSKKEKLIFTNSKGQTLEISVLSPFFLDHAEGLENMENDIYTTKNYNEDGEKEVGSNVKKRNIIIQGRIRLDKEENRSKLISFFNPKEKFAIMYTNSKIERFIKCKVEKTPVISKDTHPVFLISLLCSNPWWYAKEIKQDVAIWRGAFRFPLIIPKNKGIIMGYREPSVIVNVLNDSHNKAPLLLEFRAVGTVKNPSILNVETGDIIKLEIDMLSGDVIKINTSQGDESVELIRNKITTNIFNNLTLESNPQMALNIGDNLLRYDATSNVQNLEVAVYFTPQFVGV